IRGEESVAAGAVTLRRRGQVETTFLQKVAFKIESRLVDFLVLVSEQGAQQEGAHGSVQVLAQLQGDLYVLFQWRRNMPGNKVFGLVAGGEHLEVRRLVASFCRNIDSFLFEGFGKQSRRKAAWFRHRVRHHSGLL